MFPPGGAPRGCQPSPRTVRVPLDLHLAGQKLPLGPTLTHRVEGGSLGFEELGRASQLAPQTPALWPGLSKPVWQAARPGVGAVTDRLVIGKLPSLAQECCLVTMATFTTSSLTKARGICYLKPERKEPWASGTALIRPVPFDPYSCPSPQGLPAASHTQGQGQRLAKASPSWHGPSHIPKPGLAGNQVQTGWLPPPGGPLQANQAQPGQHAGPGLSEKPSGFQEAAECLVPTVPGSHCPCGHQSLPHHVPAFLSWSSIKEGHPAARKSRSSLLCFLIPELRRIFRSSAPRKLGFPQES